MHKTPQNRLQTSPIGMRIGINPICWTNDDLPQLGATTPLSTCLAEGCNIGYRGFEMGHKFPRDSIALRKALKPYNLELISGWFSGQLLSRGVDAEIAALQAHLQLLSEFDCEVCVYAETSASVQSLRDTPLSHRPHLKHSNWARYGHRLSLVAAAMKDFGLTMAYHPHMGTVVETAEDIHHLMAHVSNDVGLLIDTGHLTFAGASPLDIFHTYADRVCHVHCKDVRSSLIDDALNRDDSFLESVLAGVFTVPGDGDFQFQPLVRALLKKSYTGWLVVEAEQDPVIALPKLYAERGYQTLTSYISQAR